MSDKVEDPEISRDEIITPLEFVQRQLDQEAEALALYPGSFNKCTYLEGPLNQPVYVCLTCKENPDRSDKGPAGICYSCSISCHADHELLELFNKRNYTCECGTKKFPSKCTLEKGIKSGSSSDNIQLIDSEGWRKTITTNEYTQNHDGLYCWCHKKYDPVTEEDEMIQCLDCQEWYHRKCIGVNELDEEKSEFICSTCVSKYPILSSYIKSDVFVPVKRLDSTVSSTTTTNSETLIEDLPVDVLEIDKVLESPKISSLKRSLGETDSPQPASAGIISQGNTPRSRKLFKHSNSDTASLVCTKPVVQNKIGFTNLSLFAKKDWTEKLCRCEKCEDEYYEQNMEHLLKEEDLYTPEEDNDPVLSLHDAGLAALSKLPHENAIELAKKMETMRAKLHDYLAPFAASGKVITKEDIQAFFQNVNSRCKP